MATHELLQEEVNKVFLRNFKYTPLTERLKDINRENIELQKYLDFKNLREEAGDLLCSVIQLCNENDWDIEQLIHSTLDKIERRHEQYQSLGRKVKVALLGGAFNPPTKAHIQLAKFVLNTSGEFDEVWLLPAYGHMNNKTMVSPEHRLEMCRIAAQSDARIKVFDYEIQHKLGGETYFLFKSLKEEPVYNDHFHFSMIIGMDNANSFDKWVNFEETERMARFVVVTRAGIPINEKVNWYRKAPHILLIDDSGSIMDTSSTVARLALSEGEYPEHILDKEVINYIKANNLYGRE